MNIAGMFEVLKTLNPGAAGFEPTTFFTVGGEGVLILLRHCFRLIAFTLLIAKMTNGL
jgi:hypothetical protein